MKNTTVALITLLTAAPALAAPWVVNAAHSTLTFTATQAGESFNGGFKQFTPVIEFDEAAPEKGAIRVSVIIGSVFVDGKERAEALPTRDWFDAKTFPTAEFISTKITRDLTVPHRYRAEGMLSLRGITKPVTLDFTLATNEKITHAKGTVALSRHDFNIGQGQWADDKWIAYPVQLQFDITATPAAK